MGAASVTPQFEVEAPDKGAPQFTIEPPQREAPESALHQFYGWVLGKYGPDAEKYKDTPGLLQEFHDDMNQHVQGVEKQMEHGEFDVPGSPVRTALAHAGADTAVAAGGMLRDAAGVAQGMATPQNAALAAASAVLPIARLPIGMYYAFKGTQDAVKPQEEGETSADALQRRLLGGAGIAGGMAGAASGLEPAGNLMIKAGDSLLDYAPKIGQALGTASRYGGGTAAAASLLRGNLKGAALGTVGAAVSPIVERAGTAAAEGAGTAGLVAGHGVAWLGQMMKADMAGVQPLPATRAAIEQHPQIKGLLPAAPTELPASSAAESSPEGVLPAQKIIFRDPKTGQMRVMYGSGTGPTLYNSEPSLSRPATTAEVTGSNVADSLLTRVAQAEAKGQVKPYAGPMSIINKADQPFFEAAQKQLGADATPEQVGQLARKFKGQDEFVSKAIQGNNPKNGPPLWNPEDERPVLFGPAAGRPEVRPTDWTPPKSGTVEITKPDDVMARLQQSVNATADTKYWNQAKTNLGSQAGFSEIAQEAQRLKGLASGAQGGHAGGGVTSVEELSRPGVNYVVSKTGKLTYQGKAFDPGSTPSGSSHVTVLPNGMLRVNAGQQLTAVQELAIRNALRK